MQQGIWLSNNQFQPLTKETRQLSAEIATRERQFGLGSLGWQLPNPDIVLKKLGRDIAVYKDLLSDAHVGGCVRRKKAAVLALERHLEHKNASTEIVEFVERILDKLPLDEIISEALDATLYGYQPMEVNWKVVDAFWEPISVIGKPPEWFHFDQENRLRFKSKKNTVKGDLLPDKKFLLFRQNASYTNPYGIGDLSRCFWPAQFKRGSLKFWVTFTERFGTPWIIGKHPRGTSVVETEDMLNRLEEMIQDAIAVVPDDSSIEIVEATGRTASADIYERLLFFCRSEISIALLGQNQTIEATSNLASAQAGMSVTEDIRDADARMVMRGINELIDWIVEINFGLNEKRPKFLLTDTDQQKN